MSILPVPRRSVWTAPAAGTWTFRAGTAPVRSRPRSGEWERRQLETSAAQREAALRQARDKARLRLEEAVVAAGGDLDGPDDAGDSAVDGRVAAIMTAAAGGVITAGQLNQIAQRMRQVLQSGGPLAVVFGAAPAAAAPAPLPAATSTRMLVGYRTWAVRQVPTGRTLQRFVPRYERQRESWFAAGMPDWPDWPPVELRGQIETYPEVDHVLIGLAGTDSPECDWQPGRNAARCTRAPYTYTLAVSSTGADDAEPVSVVSEHPSPPAPGCGCGLWAVKHPDHHLPLLCPTAGSRSQRGACWCRIVGLVGLSGTVEEATNGWRASHARVLALLRPGRQFGPAARPARHYRAEEAPVAAGLASGNGAWMFGMPVGKGSLGGCPCSGCSGPGCVRADGAPVDPDERADVHVEPLAARYQVPVFSTMAELASYAAEFYQPLP